MQDSSSPNRYQTYAPCSGSMESTPGPPARSFTFSVTISVQGKLSSFLVWGTTSLWWMLHFFLRSIFCSFFSPLDIYPSRPCSSIVLTILKNDLRGELICGNFLTANVILLLETLILQVKSGWPTHWLVRSQEATKVDGRGLGLLFLPSETPPPCIYCNLKEQSVTFVCLRRWDNLMAQPQPPVAHMLFFPVGLRWRKQEAAFAVVKEYLSLVLFLKNILRKAVFYSAWHYAKSFSLEDNSCSQKKRFTRSPEGVMSYPTAPASGWELSLVSGFNLKRNGKIHSYRIPLLASLRIIFHPLWPLPLSETPDQVWRTELSRGERVKGQ